MVPPVGWLRGKIAELASEHGRFMTVAAVVLIVLGGVTLINSPGRWPQVMASLVAVLLVAYVILNVRVAVKAGITIFMTLLGAAWSFRVGSTVDPTSRAGAVWMFLVLLGFSLCMLASYVRVTPMGRWAPIGISGLIAYLTTYAIGVAGVHLGLAAVGGLLMQLTLFTVFYFLRPGARAGKNMPAVGMTTEECDDFIRHVEDAGWGCDEISKRGTGLFVWNDKHAYIVSYVDMDRKFGVAGSLKRPFLSYGGKNINSWAVRTVFDLTPSWLPRGVVAPVVLLDRKNKNGNSPKLIGARIQDSKNFVHLGIMPARKAFDTMRFRTLLEEISVEFPAPAPSAKQLAKLDSMLREPDQDDTSIDESREEPNK